MTDFRKTLRVKPGARIRLGHRDLDDTSGWTKDAAIEQAARELERLAELRRHGLLDEAEFTRAKASLLGLPTGAP